MNVPHMFPGIVASQGKVSGASRWSPRWLMKFSPCAEVALAQRMCGREEGKDYGCAGPATQALAGEGSSVTWVHLLRHVWRRVEFTQKLSPAQTGAFTPVSSFGLYSIIIL